MGTLTKYTILRLNEIDLPYNSSITILPRYLLNNKKETKINMKEALRGEGGSDVFSSTRHVNPNATQASNEFKMKFWSTDDAPLIRPLLRTQPHSLKKPEITMGVNQHHADGYGGIACERITKISGRTSQQWMAAYAALILGGSAIFGLLVKYRKPKIA